MGSVDRGSEYDLTRRVFLRGLALVYVAAFASLAGQLAGLVGDDGILPAARFLDAAEARFGTWARWYVPTVAWMVGTDDTALAVVAWLGVAAATCLFAGLAPKAAALVCWLGYLSLVCVGQVFLEFQWDGLLLEAGLLAILLAPWGVRPGAGRTATPRPLLWLCWLLVAKLNLLSGAVKLLGGDPTWASLTALEYHYWTTCLPTWTGWWAHQLPAVMHRATVLGMFAIELGAPLLILCGRRLRHLGATLLVALQVAIAATGNYGFFNLLTVVLCLTLYDDEALARLWPRAARLDRAGLPPRWRRWMVGAGAGAVALLSLTPMALRVGRADLVPAPLAAAHATLRPVRSFNAYGLFASMTTARPEIIVEGTIDGASWHAYEFRWKPGDPNVAPGFTGPHMPRLDWQMWFAALQGPRRAAWFHPFLARLAEPSPAVLDLLARDPFDGRRPVAVRATLHRYRFTTPAERRATGAWWSRELVGHFAGPVRGAP